MAYGKNRVTGKHSKDARWRHDMKGTPGPVRDMIVEGEHLSKLRMKGLAITSTFHIKRRDHW